MGRIVAVILLWFILGLYNVFTIYGNSEVDALSVLKTNLTDPNGVLQSWNISQPNPCHWFHVTCNNESSVTRVDLENANLSGRLVPELGQLTNLEYLELSNNNISGKIPTELGELKKLMSLDLYSNRLEGNIPDTLGNLKKLRFLRLYNNSLVGTIPYSLTTLSALQVLDLSNNLLTGVVPMNGSFSLFMASSFRNNSNLTFLWAPPANLQPPKVVTSGSISVTQAIAYGVGGGALFGLAVALAWWWLRKPQDHIFDMPAEGDTAVHLGKLKRYSLHELQVATGNFSNRNVIGQGGSGKVYKGQFADGSLVAVKRLGKSRTQGTELQFQTEVEVIRMAVHRNLLRLKGFCMTPTERLLVYPYMVNGSVASHLQDRRGAQAVLTWPTRARIALGAARGLAYLHEHPKIIHRGVKAANILLDDDYYKAFQPVSTRQL